MPEILKRYGQVAARCVVVAAGMGTRAIAAGGRKVDYAAGASWSWRVDVPMAGNQFQDAMRHLRKI
ncbi:MAG: hypothetical protein IH867_12275 [Chloroflexi bacterium]|nr:hypothetical protein [Chloroflexota bacterium]